MEPLLSQIDFGNEAGDDIRPEELEHLFVEQKPFIKFLDKKKTILLATAKKGVGKSALIRWIEARTSTNESDLVISCKGSDLVRSCFKLTNPISLPNDYIRDWMIRICALINQRIGAEINWAFTDDKMTLVENSELDGFRSRNLLSALTGRLTKALPKPLRATKEGAKNHVELLKRFEGRHIWLLVDDLDATYQRTEKENLELSTFFSACRYLSSLVTGITFRITMRTDVWPLIRRYDESLDKFEQYVHDITWSQSDFRTLLFKRIKTQIDQHGIIIPKPKSSNPRDYQEHFIDQVFDRSMEWGDDNKRPYQVIYTLAYHRPRWAIQLCKLAQHEAIETNDRLISKKHIDAVWGVYGKRRIDDLISEHKHQCKEVEELVNGFRGVERRLLRGDLVTWVKNRITSHMAPIIEGRVVRDPLEIAHFLYRLGFIVARIPRTDLPKIDNKEPYEHYFFSDMPDFLSSRTNEDFGAVWEVHPCYREALDIVKLNKAQGKKRKENR